MPLYLNGTEGVYGVNGTNTTPANRGSDTNTGIVYGTDTVQIATGGTTAVTVDSSQNVGIGTASPTSFGTGYVTLTLSGGTSGVFQSKVTGNDCRFYATSTETLFGNWAATPLRFLTNSTEAARITSSGQLCVGQTSNSGSEVVGINGNGSTQLGLYCTPTTAYTQVNFRNGNGAVGSISTNGSATAFNTSSDYRLKENVQPMSGALNKVAQLKPVTFNWKVDGSDGQGFIAHELQAVVPDAVTGEKDAVDVEGNPKYQGVDTSFLVATLTAAIQELSAKLDAAEARIAALEAK